MTTTTTQKQQQQQQRHLTVIVTFHIKAGQIEAWKAAHRPVWAAIATEPQALYFDIFQDPLKPGYMRLVEVWDGSREWFEKVQLKKAYYEDLWPKSRPTWEREVEIEYFERLGEGMSCKEAFFRGGVVGGQ